MSKNLDLPKTLHVRVRYSCSWENQPLEDTLKVETRLPAYCLQPQSSTLRHLLKRLFPELSIERIIAVSDEQGLTVELYEKLSELSLNLEDTSGIVDEQIRERLNVIKANIDAVLKATITD